MGYRRSEKSRKCLSNLGLAPSSSFPASLISSRQSRTLKVLKLVCIGLHVEVGFGIGPSLVDSRPVKGTGSVDLGVVIAQRGSFAPSRYLRQAMAFRILESAALKLAGEPDPQTNVPGTTHNPCGS